MQRTQKDRVRALGYDPIDRPSGDDQGMSTTDGRNALVEARKLLNLVVFVARDGTKASQLAEKLRLAS